MKRIKQDEQKSNKSNIETFDKMINIICSIHNVFKIDSSNSFALVKEEQQLKSYHTNVQFAFVAKFFKAPLYGHSTLTPIRSLKLLEEGLLVSITLVNSEKIVDANKSDEEADKEKEDEDIVKEDLIS